MGLTTDRNDPCLQNQKEDGLNSCYLILSEEERSKGFVRPVRKTYVHTCGAATTMAQEIAETYARLPNFYGATYCIGCRKHLPVEEFVWDGTSEKLGT